MAEQTATKPRKPQILKGFRDYQPRQMILRQRIIGIFRDVFERHGFEPLDTPGAGIPRRSHRQGRREREADVPLRGHRRARVGLRYDLTVPLARVVAMHQNDLVLPFKRYHIAPVWRAEKPQRGRFREFWQCDADIAGFGVPAGRRRSHRHHGGGAEGIGLPEFTISISHRRLLESLGRAAGVPADEAAALYRSIDKLDKIGERGVTGR